MSFNTDFSSSIKRTDEDVKEGIKIFLEMAVEKIKEILPAGGRGAEALTAFNPYSIDIRQILADNGIYMRAHTPDGCGDYDWLCVEGLHCYIFNVGGLTSKEITIQKIKQILYEYNVQHSFPI